MTEMASKILLTIRESENNLHFQGKIMTAITSKTAACDYLPPLPTWAFSYNPVTAINGLVEAGKIVYQMAKVKNKANSNDPQYKVFESRVYKVSVNAFACLLGYAYNLQSLQILKILKNEELYAYSQSHPSIQSITQEIRKIASAALEEHIECHQRMYIGGWLKQCCGVVLNPNLDASKYLCVGKDVDQIQDIQATFDYMIRIAPQELTKNMRALRARALEGYNRNPTIKKELAELTIKNLCRIHKICMKTMCDLIVSFARGTHSALSSNRSPVLYPYNLPQMEQYNEKVEQQERKRIVRKIIEEKLSPTSALCELYNIDQTVKKYELMHGEVQI